MKRLFCIMAAMLLALGTMTGCSSPKDSTPPSQTEGTQVVYKFKVGHSQAPSHPFNGTMEFFAQKVKEKTGGQVQIDIFPNSQLGDEQTMMDSLKMGTLDFLMANASNTASHVPEMGLISVCFLFDGPEHLAQVTADKKIFEKYNEIVKKKNLGFSLLNIMGNGARHLYTAKKVSSLNDLKNQKIRIMPSAIDNRVWSALGTMPTTVAFNEIYTALQTKMVDGAENTFSSYAASKHNEVAPFVALTEHQWLITQLWASDKTLAKLPEKLVTAIYEAAAETSPYALKLQMDTDAEFQKQLEANGVAITKIDTKPMRDIIVPLQDTIAKELNSEDILARIRELK